MREWLIALGILIVVAILLDGLRRMRNARRDALQMSLSMHRGLGRTDADEFGNEFPSGPARVVAQRQPALDEPELLESIDPLVSLADTARRQPPDLAQMAPLLMDVREDVRQEPSFDESAVLDDEVDDEADEVVGDAPLVRGVKNASPVFDSATVPLGLGESDVLGKPRVYERPADKPAPRREAPVIKPSKPVIKAQQEREQEREQQKVESAPAPKPQQMALEEVLIISVMARERSGFAGAALLEVLLSCGLRYGHRNIFHCYTGDESEEESLFSVVNAVKPGTFDLNSMASFNTPGISLFLTLPVPGQSSAMDAFEKMLATARAVADQLGGELRDENRSVMTGQTIEHCRQRIRDFDMHSRLRAR